MFLAVYAPLNCAEEPCNKPTPSRARQPSSPTCKVSEMIEIVVRSFVGQGHGHGVIVRQPLKQTSRNVDEATRSGESRHFPEPQDFHCKFRLSISDAIDFVNDPAHLVDRPGLPFHPVGLDQLSTKPFVKWGFFGHVGPSSLFHHRAAWLPIATWSGVSRRGSTHERECT